MNFGCSIFTKWQLILKELVSEVGVLDQRAKKGWQIEGFFQTFLIFQIIITFEVLGDAQVGS